jgi:hypothetical protein
MQAAPHAPVHPNEAPNRYKTVIKTVAVVGISAGPLPLAKAIPVFGAASGMGAHR